ERLGEAGAALSGALPRYLVRGTRVGSGRVGSGGAYRCVTNAVVTCYTPATVARACGLLRPMRRDPLRSRSTFPLDRFTRRLPPVPVHQHETVTTGTPQTHLDERPRELVRAAEILDHVPRHEPVLQELRRPGTRESPQPDRGRTL